MKHPLKNPICILLLSVLWSSCTNNGHEFDATGTFEADETIISSEASGKLLSFKVDEGQELPSNQYLGYIDTTQLALTKAQLEAQIKAVLSRKPDIASQLVALNEQLKAARKEKARIENLLKSDAATPKQLDDVDAQINIINGNITGLRTSLVNNSRSLDQEIGPLEAQILQMEDKIAKSKIINPVNGTVLSVYAEPYEQVGPGQPLYRIADLSELTLKAYISGDQFAQVKLNQKVSVYTDDGNGGYKEDAGTIYWISEKAEFTPKSVQTKNERANKVYAVKIRVKNNGSYKIGMYGEVTFDTES
ncbi:HlyD family secretion protein [Reichenbachiella ulvae]|uniref:HlyD family efflux transporter periplasmic adaptor subunit n=1 Tax=Reichenbachiella ulvae TaxID=2980104 RepID=A0ABT3CR12_9BACT|nr:HlyD family efflux transporter periplasmic adaptor subunit [Reichenbachiella ulvae]MCV9386072.1 HlyD family efflux transporter periplasmic adaptor subunit [Reichenbachiella ulvae]